MEGERGRRPLAAFYITPTPPPPPRKNPSKNHFLRFPDSRCRRQAGEGIRADQRRQVVGLEEGLGGRQTEEAEEGEGSRRSGGRGEKMIFVFFSRAPATSFRRCPPFPPTACTPRHRPSCTSAEREKRTTKQKRPRGQNTHAHSVFFPFFSITTPLNTTTHHHQQNRPRPSRSR